MSRVVVVYRGPTLALLLGLSHGVLRPAPPGVVGAGDGARGVAVEEAAAGERAGGAVRRRAAVGVLHGGAAVRAGAVRALGH